MVSCIVILANSSEVAHSYFCYIPVKYRCNSVPFYHCNNIGPHNSVMEEKDF